MTERCPSCYEYVTKLEPNGICTDCKDEQFLDDDLVLVEDYEGFYHPDYDQV